MCIIFIAMVFETESFLFSVFSLLHVKFNMEKQFLSVLNNVLKYTMHFKNEINFNFFSSFSVHHLPVLFFSNLVWFFKKKITIHFLVLFLNFSDPSIPTRTAFSRVLKLIYFNIYLKKKFGRTITT